MVWNRWVLWGNSSFPPINFPNPTTIRQNTPMRHLTVSTLVSVAVLLGSAGEGWSLPPCPGTYNETTWTNCFGTDTYANGNKYVGEWKNGKYHGQGTFTFPSGEKHVGKWKNQLPNGQGVHTYTDGRIEEGIFENGKFLDTEKPSPTN